MEKMTTVQARENFSELINQAAYGNKQIILTRRGRPLVAMISVDDLAILQASKRRLESTVDSSGVESA